jgi:hypothetical protein
MTMRNACWATALMLACGTAAASGRDINVDCNVMSDYDFSLTDKSVILTRKDGEPKMVLMRQGRLFIDDKWVQVGDADRDRLAEYERTARAAVPLAQQIGRDAADIAFTALGEVAKGFSKDPRETEAKMKKARAELDAQLERSMSATHFNGEDLGKSIGDAVGEVVPVFVGDIVGGTLRAAFSGDTARLQEMDDLDIRIDAIIEPRTKALEHNADALCMKMRALDGIDAALDYRFQGKPLDLLRVEAPRHEHRDDSDSD